MMDISTNPAVYCHNVAPAKADIDFMGHVNNAMYLTWIQAATLGQWRETAPADIVDKFAWVAVKHEITYRKPAFLNEPLRVKVRVRQVRRESAFYDVSVDRDGEVLVEAISRWCCLDAETRKPIRIPADIADMFCKC